jgi:hypothetical protein
MVKLTIDLIARGTSGYTKKKRDESMQQYLKRLTHLYLEDRCIDEVVNKHAILLTDSLKKKIVVCVFALKTFFPLMLINI